MDDVTLEQMVKECEEVKDMFTEKSIDFLEDMVDKFEVDPDFQPTPAQEDWIRDLYKQACDSDR